MSNKFEGEQMNTQPEALRLADAIDEAWWLCKDRPTTEMKAATELRRLQAERDELLAAVKYIANFCQLSLDNPKFRIDEKACDLIRAAIAKAGGKQ